MPNTDTKRTTSHRPDTEMAGPNGTNNNNPKKSTTKDTKVSDNKGKTVRKSTASVSNGPKQAPKASDSDAKAKRTVAKSDKAEPNPVDKKNTSDTKPSEGKNGPSEGKNGPSEGDQPTTTASADPIPPPVLPVAPLPDKFDDTSLKFLEYCKKFDWNSALDMMKNIELTIDYRVFDEKTKWTPLLYAVKDARIDMVEKFLALGMDTNAKTKVCYCNIFFGGRGRDFDYFLRFYGYFLSFFIIKKTFGQFCDSIP